MKIYNKIVFSLLLLLVFTGVVQAKEPTFETFNNEVSISYDVFVYYSF